MMTRDWRTLDEIGRTLLPEGMTMQLLARRRGPSGTAAELGLSRQTISNRRAAIEELLGGKLLEAHGRGQLTPLGTRTDTFFKAVTRELDLFLIDVDQMRNGKTIRVASNTSTWSAEKPTLEECFRKLVPDGSLVQADAGDDAFSIEAEVRDGRADVGILSYPPRQLDSPLTVEHWRNEPMMLVVSGRRRLLRPIAKAEPTDFENHDTFVNLRPKFAMAKEVAMYLSRNRIRLPHKLSHFSEIASVKQALIDDDGIGILPEPTVRQEQKDGRLQAYPLMEPLVRRIGIVYRRDSLERPAVRAFLESFPREKRSVLRSGKSGVQGA